MELAVFLVAISLTAIASIQARNGCIYAFARFLVDSIYNRRVGCQLNVQ